MSPRSRIAVAMAMAGLAGELGCGPEAQHRLDEAPAAVLTISFDAPLKSMVKSLRIRSSQSPAFEIQSTIQASDGRTPVQIALGNLEPSQLLRVSVEAFSQPGAVGSALVVRRASTHVVAGRSLALPLRINDECIRANSDRDLLCLGATCKAGVCAPDYVHPSDLPDFDDAAPALPASRCGPIDAGEPTIQLGPPTAPFRAFTKGEEIVPQQGYQGASHFFFGLRVVGVHDPSALFNYFGKLLDTDRISNAVLVGGPYDTDADACYLFELPFVLPPGVVAAERFRLGATVFDQSHNAGSTSVELMLAAPLAPDQLPPP